MARPTINSRKHIIQFSPIVVAAGGINPITLAEAVQDLGVGTTANKVAVGSVIKAIWVELWALSDTATAVGSTNITIEKLPSGLADMSFGNSQAIFVYPNKNNIFYMTQGLVGEENGGTPIPFLRQWIKIPKGKQRMSLGDKLKLNVAGITGISFCTINIYKEYF